MSPINRRHFSLGLAASAAATGAWARDSALPVPASLQVAGRDAAQKGEPLVLLVSLPGCPYCELVRRSYLLPMRAEGLHAWQINVTDHLQPVRDFAGVPSSGAALARQWQATFTPTVLFFDARGNEIAKRLVGVAVPDFYGAYLDAELATARGKLTPRRGT
ncbi:MAG: thioredoxin fold domain-containing protein [Proteobacteria bacterium]|nr:thioredoxin fold domain-containing protein [Ramlibacter sp.]MCA0215660.1 thioredoxin fold domain-containing protein [Pseudomonadota bacterium]